MVQNNSGHHLALGLYGELLLINIDSLESLPDPLDDGIATEIIDIAATPCGQILVVNQLYTFQVWDMLEKQKFC